MFSLPFHRLFIELNNGHSPIRCLSIHVYKKHQQQLLMKGIGAYIYCVCELLFLKRPIPVELC